jgi:hypothetical protein
MDIVSGWPFRELAVGAIGAVAVLIIGLTLNTLFGRYPKLDHFADTATVIALVITLGFFVYAVGLLGHG